MSRRRSLKENHHGDGDEAVEIKISIDGVYKHLLYEKKHAVSLAKGSDHG